MLRRDIAVRSRRKGDHLRDLREVFDLMRAHQLKMNPTKSFLGVSSDKFLGFVVTSKKIHLDPEKISAIRDMEPPRSLKELRGLQEKLAYIQRFISNLSGRCQPFSKLMRKGVTFLWDQACQDAFDEIKHYLTTPPVLVPPTQGKPFFLYVRSMEHSLGALLAQKSDEGHEQAIYYLSRTMDGAEHRYNLVKKECLALVFAVQKTRHYLTGETIYVVSKINPLRLLMTKPSALNGRLTKCAMLLSQYDIHFLSQEATKGQAIADLLVENPRSNSATLFEELPDETAEVHSAQINPSVWQMYFDGASRTIPRAGLVAGVGIIFISPRNHVIPRAFSLAEPCTNNVAEYSALLIGLQLAHHLGVRKLQAYGDSELVVNQLRREYEVRSDDLIPYFDSALQMAEQFEGFYIGHVPRQDNTHVVALAGLATSLCLQAGEYQNILVCA